MTYPVPPSTFTSLAARECSSDIVRMHSDNGKTLEVSYLDRFGWCLESRIDQENSLFKRQPFTGNQAEFETVPVEMMEEGESLSLRVGSDELCIAEKNLSFSLRREGSFLAGTKDFSSHTFSHHDSAVELFENVQSLKVTDMEERMGSVRKKTKYESHMVRLQLARPQGTVLGLAGQAGEFNRNGYRFQLYNTDLICLFLPDRRPGYQSWPIVFYPSDDMKHWVGLFFDNPSRTFVDVGDFYPDSLTFESVSGNQRLYICNGESLQEVSQKMSTLLGAPPELPNWAFGYQQSRWSYMSEDEVLSVASQLREKQIPCDAIHFDIDYMDEFRVFTKNEETFGGLRSCLGSLEKSGFKSLCIIDPGVKIDPDYEVFQCFEKLPHLRNPDGSTFEAKVWPGSSLFPDFKNEEVSTAWAAFTKKWLEEFPFDGVWLDMNEPSNFDGQNETNAKTCTEQGLFRDEYNLYGYYMSQAAAKGCEDLNRSEPGLLISRSGYPGIQRCAVTWHGDNQAWWEHLRLAIDHFLGFSMSGLFYSGPDIPGFSGCPSDDLAVRFFQLGAFMPFFRGHSIYYAKDKEPYAFGEKANALIKKAIELRYSLLREWITGFALARKNNLSPVFPVFDQQYRVVRDHMLLFDKFLVAPVIERDQSRKPVYLPKGDWYRFGDPEQILNGDQWLLEEVDLESVPIYVRAGSVVTRNTVGENTAETLGKPEEHIAYPSKQGQANSSYLAADGSLQVLEFDAHSSSVRVAG